MTKIRLRCCKCRKQIDEQGNVIGDVIEGKNISDGWCKEDLAEYKKEIEKMKAEYSQKVDNDIESKTKKLKKDIENQKRKK